MGKPERLDLIDRIDIPIVEASGVASRTTAAGRRQVLVVGDRTSKFGVGTVDGGEVTGWEVFDLTDFDGWRPPDGDSQFEAIAADGERLVAVMREEPPVVLVVDVRAERLVSRITLDDHPALVGLWDEENSRGEGLVLLRGGRLLVAKEKHPAALVEFAPAGTPARGLSHDDFLGAAESWDSPTGDVTYCAVAVWRLADDASDDFEDVSAIGETDDRDLWLLSDKSRTFGRLRLDVPLPADGGTIDTIDEVWRLPKHTDKPEGLAALAPRRFLVCLDTDSTEHNGFVIAPPD